MARWPVQVTYAFEQLGYEDYAPRIQKFTETWGDLSLETFTRVLQDGQGEDRVIAIFAVGSQGSAGVREHLLPFLESVQPMERWASALCLGAMKEDRARTHLLHIITEFLPSEGKPAYQGERLWLFNNWRYQAILLLTAWSQPEVVTTLLHALPTFRKLEQMLENNPLLKREWRNYQEYVMYTLGWLGRFDVLTELVEQFGIAQPTLSSWRVYLALGSLHVHQVFPRIFSRSIPKQSPLREQVKAVLGERFDLSPEEQDHCLAYYQAQQLW
jgi:hypothetical protein